MKDLLICLFLIGFVACSNVDKSGESDYEEIEEQHYEWVEQEESEVYDENDYSNGSYANQRSQKPNLRQIEYDLVGHKLAEGSSNKYFKDGTVWEIRDGNISDFTLVEVLADNEFDYELVATMILKSGYAKFNVKFQIYYSFNNDKWELVNINSLSVQPISDSRFEGCLTYEIGDDGWGGITCLKITNNCETPLLVGGRILTEYDGWHNFSKQVDAFSTVNVGGTLTGWGSVSDYEIHFVMRK